MIKVNQEVFSHLLVGQQIYLLVQYRFIKTVKQKLLENQKSILKIKERIFLNLTLNKENLF